MSFPRHSFRTSSSVVLSFVLVPNNLVGSTSCDVAFVLVPNRATSLGPWWSRLWIRLNSPFLLEVMVVIASQLVEFTMSVILFTSERVGMICVMIGSRWFVCFFCVSRGHCFCPG